MMAKEAGGKEKKERWERVVYIEVLGGGRGGRRFKRDVGELPIWEILKGRWVAGGGLW